MEDQRFGTVTFWKWFFYGVYQGFMVLIFTMIVIQEPSASMDASGKIFGFWASGQQLYAAVVLLANAVLLKMHNLHNGWSELFMFLQATAYFWILGLETLSPAFTVVYGLWEEYVSSIACWFAVFLCVFWIHTIEKMCRFSFDHFFP